MPLLWGFRCYRALDGEDKIREWYENESKRVRGKFLSRLRSLASLQPTEWRDPLFKRLHGECHGLGEIRFKADDVQQRPLGFRSGEFEFTILFCAIEKGGKFVPSNACAIANSRKDEVLKNRSRTNAFWIALE